MDEETWAGLAPELLMNVVTRVQQGRGEGRRVVSIAGVCRSWRQQILQGQGPKARSKVRHKCRSDCPSGSSCCCCKRYGYGDQGPPLPGILEFPWTLLHPGPRGASHPPIQCLLKRKGSYFVLLQTPWDERNGEQFLLAAKRKWRPTGFSYIIGKDPRHLGSRSGPDALGKLKSNFWASGFVLWEKRKCEDDDDEEEEEEEDDDRLVPVVSLRFMEHIVNGIRQRRIQCWLPQPCKQVGGLNFLLEKRKKQHFVHSCSSSSPSSLKSWMRSWSCLSEGFKGSSGGQARNYSSARMLEIATTTNSNSTVTASAMDDEDDQQSTKATPAMADEDEDMELRSKVPAWDAQQQCWSLDFKGRATMPSMHNFQLIRAEPDADNNNNNVIVLQLGKIGKNLYTMDFAYPLSAFQAFAICLSSFATSAGLEP